jgi:hypothetical protein
VHCPQQLRCLCLQYCCQHSRLLLLLLRLLLLLAVLLLLLLLQLPLLLLLLLLLRLHADLVCHSQLTRRQTVLLPVVLAAVCAGKAEMCYH